MRLPLIDGESALRERIANPAQVPARAPDGWNIATTKTVSRLWSASDNT